MDSSGGTQKVRASGFGVRLKVHVALLALGWVGSRHDLGISQRNLLTMIVTLLPCRRDYGQL